MKRLTHVFFPVLISISLHANVPPIHLNTIDHPLSCFRHLHMRHPAFASIKLQKTEEAQKDLLSRILRFEPCLRLPVGQNINLVIRLK